MVFTANGEKTAVKMEKMTEFVYTERKNADFAGWKFHRMVCGKEFIYAQYL